MTLQFHIDEAHAGDRLEQAKGVFITFKVLLVI